ncbi:MAG: hypothetical protein NW220_24210 [Leptolyngbyaceae cyanobacterium bins.349]|nr:hypothetical protein [Leptolyngbyaceae cyanobacterium bins.349]
MNYANRCICWRILRRTYPWLPWMLITWQILVTHRDQRDRVLLRWWSLLYRLDWANLLAIAMDMIQPEYWM